MYNTYCQSTTNKNNKKQNNNERAVMATLTASGLDYELSATSDSKILELDKILVG